MTWISPFSLSGSWFKGNLHTHTTQSDGLRTPEEAITWYRERGYDFVAITDHWVYTSGACVTPSFCTVSGSELHGPGYHMLAVGIRFLPDRQLEDSPAALAADVCARGGLAYLAHPYWTGQASADIAPISSAAGLEVFNSVCEQMDGLGYARVQWDELLAAGHRLNGLAVDDVHWKHGAEGRGFVMVHAPNLSEGAILRALKEGHFYASTGPTIADLRIVESAEGSPMLRVRCSPCQAITFYATAAYGVR